MGREGRAKGRPMEGRVEAGKGKLSEDWQGEDKSRENGGRGEDRTL